MSSGHYVSPQICRVAIGRWSGDVKVEEEKHFQDFVQLDLFSRSPFGLADERR